MNIEKLEIRNNAEDNKKLTNAYLKIKKLLEALRNKQLSSEAIVKINEDIDSVNSFSKIENNLVSEKELTKQINKAYCDILKYTTNKLKLFPKNHYRNMWLGLGMSAFGIPFGMAFSSAVDNYGLIGVGLPIGMAIGMALGTALDKKVALKGEQLDLDV